jgi:hypothetical protein
MPASATLAARCYRALDLLKSKQRVQAAATADDQHDDGQHAAELREEIRCLEAVASSFVTEYDTTAHERSVVNATLSRMAL